MTGLLPHSYLCYILTNYLHTALNEHWHQRGSFIIELADNSSWLIVFGTHLLYPALKFGILLWTGLGKLARFFSSM